MKKLLNLSISILSIVVLSSCHGRLVPKTTTETNPVTKIDFEDFDESKTYNITFWAKNDSNVVQKKAYEDAVTRFHEIYPNINVEIKDYTDYQQIYADVLLNIPTNTTPNVCIAYPDNVATYSEGENVVLNLSSVMDDPKYGLGGSEVKFDSVKKEEIHEKFLNEGLINGSYYTLPFMRSSEALYINKQYVERLGEVIPDVPTWEWVWKVCNLALEEKKNELDNNSNADRVLYPFIYKSVDNWFISYCKQMGWDFTVDGKVKYLNDTTKSFLLDLYTKAHSGALYNYQVDGKDLKTGVYAIFKNVSYPGNSFNKWRAVMCVDSTAGATWIGSGATSHDAGSASSGDSFDTVVRPIPQVDPNNPKLISQGPSICVFNKADKQEVLASWLFAQYLLTDDIQLSYSQTEGYLPVTKRATSSERFNSYMNNPSQYKVKLDATKLILDNIDNTFITPVFNGSSNARTAAGYLIEAVSAPGSKFDSIEKMDDLFQRAIRFNDLVDLV